MNVYLFIVLLLLVTVLFNISLNNDRTYTKIKNISKLPQSGFCITCLIHGKVPISKKEYKSQLAKYQLRCPFCQRVPIRIWKR